MAATLPAAPPPSGPSVDDIPYASQLQTQLAVLNQAISLLDSGGVVSFLTVIPAPAPAPVGGSQPGPAPISVYETRVSLDPPISDPTAVANVAAQLQQQADAITQQLATMGYAPSTRGLKRK